MAFGDVLRTEEFSFNTTSLTLTSAVVVGNTILVFSNSATATVSDDLNGAYTQAVFVDPASGAECAIHFVVSTDGGSAPTVSTSGGQRAAVVEAEGSLSFSGVSGTIAASGATGSSVAWQTTSGSIPENSASFGVFNASGLGSGVTLDSPWSALGSTTNNCFVALGARQDATATTDNFSGTHAGLSESSTISAVFASFTSGGAADTTAPTFTSTPTVTATTETGHTISSTLDETGTIYGVRLTDGAGAPSSAQVKAGQDSAGSAAPEATSVAATAATSADLVFSTGSASTAYDYYIVAEDDEGTPNLQASPTLVEATTAATPVEGLPVYTLKKDGSALGNLTGIKVRVTATGELDGTEYYSANNLTATAGVMDSTIDLSATAATIGDTVTVEILTTANEGIVFTDLVEDIA